MDFLQSIIPSVRGEYDTLVTYSPVYHTPELDHYWEGYKRGIRHLYFEGRWRDGAFHEQWMNAINADNEWVRREAVGYREALQMTPQPP